MRTQQSALARKARVRMCHVALLNQVTSPVFATISLDRHQLFTYTRECVFPIQVVGERGYHSGHPNVVKLAAGFVCVPIQWVQKMTSPTAGSLQQIMDFLDEQKSSLAATQDLHTERITATEQQIAARQTAIGSLLDRARQAQMPKSTSKLQVSFQHKGKLHS